VISKAKLFSGAATEFGAEPNTQVSPVDAAFPGMLPVNQSALRRASGQDRARPRRRDQPDERLRPQELLLPDLPAGYQISQYQQPVVGRGRGHR